MNGETYTFTSRVGNMSINDVLGELNKVQLDENAEVASGDATTSATNNTGNNNNNSAGTVQTAAQIQGMAEADLLAAAQGGVNEDLAATKADTTGTAATDLATAVTNAVDAITSKYTTTNLNGVSFNDVTYTDENGDAQTALTQTSGAVAQSDVDTVASTVGDALKAAAEKAAKDSATTGVADIKTAIATVLDSVKVNNVAVSGVDSTTLDTEVGNLAKAVLADQAVQNATQETTTTPSTDNSSSASDTAVVSPNVGQGHGIQGGKISSNSAYIGQSTADDPVNTADGTSGLTVTAAYKGISGQISGLTFSITDSEGNVKKAANAALDNFRTTIYAKNASEANELTFQVGASANQAITVSLDDMRSEALGLKGSNGTKVSVATQEKANAAVAVFDNAIQKALDQQTTIGAIEARLDYTSQNLTTSSENVQAAESTIRDADMAKEMTNYTKNNVLLQAAQSMLAQANQSSSAVLSLLQ